MADVKYTLEVQVPTASDAVVFAAMEAVDIAPVLSERASQFTLCSDVTSIFAPGIIHRTIIAALTTDLQLKHPTSNDQYNVCLGAFKNRFSSMLPARVLESVEIGIFCP